MTPAISYEASLDRWLQPVFLGHNWGVTWNIPSKRSRFIDIYVFEL